MERAREAALGCRRCPLSETRTQVAYGTGDPQASLVLLGEAPGEQEDATGLPFQGAAGRVLDGLLREAGIDRSTVWITNTALCRPMTRDPVRNRAPSSAEVEACSAHLDVQLELIRPRVVATLGVVPAERLLGAGVLLEKQHGQPVHLGSMLVVPTFHPASLHYRAGRRAAAVADLRRACELAQPAERD